MTRSSQFKLVIAAVVALMFAGFVLRAAVRLANAAMHSFLVLALLFVIFVWAMAKFR
jgi:hypothetical protein